MIISFFLSNDWITEGCTKPTIRIFDFHVFSRFLSIFIDFCQFLVSFMDSSRLISIFFHFFQFSSIFMDFCQFLLIFMNSSRFLSIFANLSQFLLTFMVLCRFLWIFIDFHGCLPQVIKQSCKMQIWIVIFINLANFTGKLAGKVWRAL